MTQGHVEGPLALVEVAFLLPDRSNEIVTFIVDTGFEGALSLPRSEILRLGLPQVTQEYANLADDTRVPVDIYEASIMWQGERVAVAVLAIGIRPLLGTSLLANRHLGIDFVDGGPVIVRDLP